MRRNYMDESWRCLSCEEMSWLVESLSEPAFISECSVGKRDVTEAFKPKSYAKCLPECSGVPGGVVVFNPPL